MLWLLGADNAGTVSVSVTIYNISILQPPKCSTYSLLSFVSDDSAVQIFVFCSVSAPSAVATSITSNLTVKLTAVCTATEKPGRGAGFLTRLWLYDRFPMTLCVCWYHCGHDQQSLWSWRWIYISDCEPGYWRGNEQKFNTSMFLAVRIIESPRLLKLNLYVFVKLHHH